MSEYGIRVFCVCKSLLTGSPFSLKISTQDAYESVSVKIWRLFTGLRGVCFIVAVCSTLESQVAGNNRPLDPKVDHYWLKVAQNYEPLALQD